MKKKLTALLLCTVTVFSAACAATQPEPTDSVPTVCTITADSGENGTVSPAGEIRVTCGEDQTFTITPDAGYRIADVTVDGESKGAIGSYTFETVSQDHTIHAIFETDILTMIEFDKKADMTYTFTGDEKEKAGFAQGILTVTPTASDRTDGYYLVYLANETGVLETYDEFACMEITGETVSSPYGTQDSDGTLAEAAFGDRESDVYQTALQYLGGYGMREVVLQDGVPVFCREHAVGERQ